MRAYLVALALVVSACGEDQAPPPPPKAPAPRRRPVEPPARSHPDQTADADASHRRPRELSTPSDAKKCDPKAPLCEVGQFCIAARTTSIAARARSATRSATPSSRATSKAPNSRSVPVVRDRAAGSRRPDGKSRRKSRRSARARSSSSRRRRTTSRSRSSASSRKHASARCC